MVKNSAASLLTSVDDLFTTQEERDEAKRETIMEIPLSQISNFPNHPFKVKEDEAMSDLVESVKSYGVLSPVIVKSKGNGEYEMIAGHRRKRASELAGKDSIKCIVQNVTDDEAIILMVDSNLQREQLLPSEKAFAYKMKLDAMKRQGFRSDLTSATPLQKFDNKTSREIIAKQSGESHEQIRKYIRLTYLIPELLKMVDEGIVSLTASVNYSYLRQFEQLTVWMMLMEKSMSITTEKTEELKNASKEGELTEEQIRGYFKFNATEPNEKAPKKQSVKFSFDEISDFFPDMKPKEVKDKIIEILFAWYDSQQNAVMNEPTELDAVIMNGGESY